MQRLGIELKALCMLDKCSITELPSSEPRLLRPLSSYIILISLIGAEFHLSLFFFFVFYCKSKSLWKLGTIKMKMYYWIMQQWSNTNNNYIN
jgi:hypothetical protein